MLDWQLLVGKNPSLRRAEAVPVDPSERAAERAEPYEDVEAASQLWFMVEETQTAGTGVPAGEVVGDGVTDGYTVPYWTILRVVEGQHSNVNDDKDQGAQGWLFTDNVASHPTSGGPDGSGSKNGRGMTPPSPSPSPSGSSLPLGSGRGTMGLRSSEPSAAAAAAVASVCPATTLVNMKICLYHPPGSAVAADRDVVIERLKQVSKRERVTPVSVAELVMPRRICNFTFLVLS